METVTEERKEKICVTVQYVIFFYSRVLFCANSKNHLLHSLINLVLQMIELFLLYCTRFTCFLKQPFLVLQSSQKLFLLLQG